MTRCETRMNRRTMNTRSTTASGNDKKNRNGDGATKQGQKTKRAKKAKREDSATKRYRLKSLDLQQKIRLALEARRMASLTNRQIPREFQPSFRGSGGIPAPAFIVGLELMEWRRCHNERWKRMTPKEHVRMQQQVLKQIEARPSEFDASTGKRIPSARSMLGKGGILPPEGLTVDERSAWHKAHNALWERLSERERCEMKQQQTSNDHCSRNDALKNNTEVEVAREQKAPNATAAQEGIDSVRTSTSELDPLRALTPRQTLSTTMPRRSSPTRSP
ncbi:hypothetical protein CGLO_02331 [Colletotrichum gloeosporioides Cg-14]|uniref:Uncharacterized protein n=1 Tax=Colletotrichum gloeosporioides (strain Cg-14) TaxID=1237896 RepID=T0KP83_COLGC|nr:hypothetical protein CGLO_02331 [Colletotrichum gloeosporioides Cg-14]